MVIQTIALREVLPMPDDLFTTGEPIAEPNAFIGRRDLLEELLLGLDAGHSYGLVGPPKIGKSSVLAMLKHPEIGSRYRSLAAARWIHVRFEPTWYPSCEAAVWQRLVTSVHGRANSSDPYAELMAVVSDSESRPIFLLDDFDVAARQLYSAEFWRRLALVASGQCQFVLAQRHSFAEGQQPGTETRFLRLATLGVLSRDDVRELVMCPRKGCEGLSETLVEPVLSAAGQHPWLVQSVCRVAHARGDHTLNDELLAEAADAVLSEVLGWWRRLGPEESSLVQAAAARGWLTQADVDQSTAIANTLVHSGWLSPPPGSESGCVVPELISRIVLPAVHVPPQCASGWNVVISAKRGGREPSRGVAPPDALQVSPDTHTPTMPQRQNWGSMLEELEAFGREVGCRTSALCQRIRWSDDLLTRLAAECLGIHAQDRDAGSFTIAVCGSVARLEGGPGSDLDAFIIFNDYSYEYSDFTAVRGRAAEILGVLGSSLTTASDGRACLHEYQQQEENSGTFPVAFRASTLLGTVATQADSPELSTRRLCLLTESRPIFNPALFDSVRSVVEREYCLREAATVNSVPEVFVREFRSWCSSFWSRELTRSSAQGRSREIAWIKLSHQRTFSHAAMLWALATLKRGEITEQGLRDAIRTPAICRTARLGTACLQTRGLKNVRPVLADFIGRYNDSMKALGDWEVRSLLEASRVDAVTPGELRLGEIRQTLATNGVLLRTYALDVLLGLMEYMRPTDRSEFLATLLL